MPNPKSGHCMWTMTPFCLCTRSSQHKRSTFGIKSRREKSLPKRPVTTIRNLYPLPLSRILAEHIQKASRKLPRQSEHSLLFCSIQYLDISALCHYSLRTKGNLNQSLSDKKHFKFKFTQCCFVNENCEQSSPSLRLRQCVTGAACSTASVLSSNCFKFKSRRNFLDVV